MFDFSGSLKGSDIFPGKCKPPPFHSHAGVRSDGVQSILWGLRYRIEPARRKQCSVGRNPQRVEALAALAGDRDGSTDTPGPAPLTGAALPTTPREAVPGQISEHRRRRQVPVRTGQRIRHQSRRWKIMALRISPQGEGGDHCQSLFKTGHPFPTSHPPPGGIGDKKGQRRKNSARPEEGIKGGKQTQPQCTPGVLATLATPAKMVQKQWALAKIPKKISAPSAPGAHFPPVLATPLGGGGGSDATPPKKPVSLQVGHLVSGYGPDQKRNGILRPSPADAYPKGRFLHTKLKKRSHRIVLVRSPNNIHNFLTYPPPRDIDPG